MYFIPVRFGPKCGHCWLLVILCQKNGIFSCGAVDKTPVRLSKAIVPVYYCIDLPVKLRPVGAAGLFLLG